jgi:hypothetical protein
MVAAKKKTRNLRVDTTETTIQQAQVAMVEAVKSGASVACPCCRQTVKLKEQALTASMTKALIVLHRHFKDKPDWVVVSEHLASMNKLGADVKQSDWSMLPHWGFLEERLQPLSKKPMGQHRMTELGHQFARGEIKSSVAIKLYNGRFLGYVDGQVSVRESLGGGFDYDRLMSGDFGLFTV